MTRPKLYYLLRVVLTALIFAGSGVFILWAGPYADEFFDLFVIFIGLLSILFNIPFFLQSLRAVLAKTRWGAWGMLVSGLAILLGVIFLFLPRDRAAMPFLLLGYALLLPILRVIAVGERKRQVLRELPKPAVAGLVILVTVLQIEDLVFRICGFALVGVAALYLLFRLLMMQPYFEALQEKEAEDTQESSEE